MKRMFLALCAAFGMGCLGLGLGAAPAAAYVGEYSFSDRSEGATPRRAARSRAVRSEARAERSRSRRAARSANRGARSTGAGAGSGIASYYWQRQRVASGGWFNPNALTAAHRSLPFGTRVRVTNVGNGRSVTVTINDRGPFVRGRVIDLSRAAASAVGMTGQGLARVSLAVLGR